MCGLNAAIATGQGALQVGQAHIQHQGQKTKYKMGRQTEAFNKEMNAMDKAHNDKLVRQNTALERERVFAQNSELHRGRMANQFELEKEKIRATGAANVVASAEGRAGQSVDRAIFDIHQEFNQAKGNVDSEHSEGVKKSFHNINAISANFHAGLTRTDRRVPLNSVSPASSGAMLMNMAAAGLGAYNKYNELEAEDNAKIKRSSSNMKAPPK